MPFQPAVDQELVIDAVAYRVARHPASPTMAYGQEGRQGVVYQLVATSDRRALKVFKPRHRVPAMVTLAERLAAFADLPGLAVCQRVVLSARRHTELLREYPDLTYAVLMPWIDGPTWADVVSDRREFSAVPCLELARAFLFVITAMEERGVAHCDLSGPNVILPTFAEPAAVQPHDKIALVDVEGMFGPRLDRPEALPGGSPGYARRKATAEAWEAKADRFTGALLLGEMLGWYDEAVRDDAWGESYFDPTEVQTNGARYGRLVAILRERWGEAVAVLFERAWQSQSPADCPTFLEWLVALPAAPVQPTSAPTTAVKVESTASAAPLLARARTLEESGDLVGAIATYEEVAQSFPANGGLVQEIQIILLRIRERRARQVQWEHEAEEARRDEESEHWRAAAARYEGLLRESDLPTPQRETWEASLARCRREQALADLFDAAALAVAQERFDDARAKLGEILHQRPDGYRRNGVSAESMLASLDKRRGARSRGAWLVPRPGQAGAPGDTAPTVEGQAPRLAAGWGTLRSLLPVGGALALVVLVVWVVVTRPGPGLPTAGQWEGSVATRAPASPAVETAVAAVTPSAQPSASRVPPSATPTAEPATATSVPPSATPVPATVDGLPLLLSDDFRDPSRGVLARTSDNPSQVVQGYSGGDYVLKVIDPNYTDPPRITLPGTYTNTVIAVDARLVGQSRQRFVYLACRVDRENGTGYRFGLMPDIGQYFLDRYDSGTITELIALTSSSAIHRGNEPNYLELSCRGSTIATPVNGTPVASVLDSIYQRGESFLGAGVVDGTADPTVEVHFGQLVVWGDEATPAGPPSGPAPGTPTPSAVTPSPSTP